VMLQDLTPTLLGLAGVAEPSPSRPLPGVQGFAAAPARGTCASAIVAEVAPPREFLPRLLEIDPRADVAHLGAGIASASCGGLKLIEWSDGRRALYGLDADPGETNDRAAALPADAAARALLLKERASRPGVRGAFAVR
jgi:arylsulfatase A-like enzyme